MVVTGAGVVSSLGAGVDSFWDALAEGNSGASRVDVEGIGEMTAFPVADDVEDARERFVDELARFHRAAGEGPIALERLLAPLDEQDAIAVEEERAGHVPYS